MSQDRENPVRALVVDDEAFIRQILSRILDRLGIKVVGVASSGDSVVELYREHRPDLVIMDIAMPGTDGLTCLGRLKEADPGARVLICTSFSSRQYTVEAERLGAVGFLNKPFDANRIRAKLEELYPGRIGRLIP